MSACSIASRREIYYHYYCSFSVLIPLVTAQTTYALAYPMILALNYFMRGAF